MFFIYIAANLEIGNMHSATPVQIILMIVECISIGFFEEFLFRGIILNQFVINSGAGKYSALYAVIISGLAFGLFHLSNLRSGNALTVIFQILYTTMMGIAFSALMLRTKWNIIWCGMIHSLYDIASGFGDFKNITASQGNVAVQAQTVNITAELLNLALFLPLLLYGLFMVRNR